MEQTQVIRLMDEESTWQKIASDMEVKTFPFLYSVTIDNNN